jgi:hypothetical protein
VGVGERRRRRRAAVSFVAACSGYVAIPSRDRILFFFFNDTIQDILILAVRACVKQSKGSRQKPVVRGRQDNSRHRFCLRRARVPDHAMAAAATQAALDAASKLEDLAAREQALRTVVFSNQDASDAETVKVKEAAVALLADALTRQRKAEALAQLLQDLRAVFFAVIPKAKTAKIVRTVIDQIAKVPDSTDLQVRL